MVNVKNLAEKQICFEILNDMISNINTSKVNKLDSLGKNSKIIIHDDDDDDENNIELNSSSSLKELFNYIVNVIHLKKFYERDYAISGIAISNKDQYYHIKIKVIHLRNDLKIFCFN